MIFVIDIWISAMIICLSAQITKSKVLIQEGSVLQFGEVKIVTEMPQKLKNYSMDQKGWRRGSKRVSSLGPRLILTSNLPAYLYLYLYLQSFSMWYWYSCNSYKMEWPPDDLCILTEYSYLFGMVLFFGWLPRLNSQWNREKATKLHFQILKILKKTQLGGVEGK